MTNKMYAILKIRSKLPIAYKKGEELVASADINVKTTAGTRLQVTNLVLDFLYDLINCDDWRTVGTDRNQEVYETIQRVYAEIKKKNHDYISFNGGGLVVYEVRTIEDLEYDLILE
jgi:hypothetical protein